jgi:hypothetical protein
VSTSKEAYKSSSSPDCVRFASFAFAVAHRSRSLLTDPTTFGVGILSTIYPDDYYIKELRGFVTSGSEYFAPCYAQGDLLVLALPV